jgi:hypothetical protein
MPLSLSLTTRGLRLIRSAQGQRVSLPQPPEDGSPTLLVTETGASIVTETAIHIITETA